MAIHPAVRRLIEVAEAAGLSRDVALSPDDHGLNLYIPTISRYLPAGGSPPGLNCEATIEPHRPRLTGDYTYRYYTYAFETYPGGSFADLVPPAGAPPLPPYGPHEADSAHEAVEAAATWLEQCTRDHSLE